MSTPPAFTDNYRTLAFLSFLADVGSGVPEPDINTYKTDRTQKIGNTLNQNCPTQGWEIVWGPNYYWSSSTPSGAPDNVWLVVFNPQFDMEDGLGPRPVYFTCIAGTNTKSTLDVVTEDFGIARVVDFNKFAETFNSPESSPPESMLFGNDKVAVIASGTAYGANTNLPTFLQNALQTHPDATFVYGGHSLGGALTPVLALGLGLKAKKQYTFPLAGPTSGNGIFVQEYTKSFPVIKTLKTLPQGLNANYYNTLDLVPKAWAKATLESIKTMYGSALSWIVHGLVDLAIIRTDLSWVTYTDIPGITFTGPAIVPPTSISELENVIETEHVEAYTDYFGIEVFDKPDVKAIHEQVRIMLAAGMKRMAL